MTSTTMSCTGCDRASVFSTTATGSADERARVGGWRIGTNGRGRRVTYCPACSGTDPDYWDRMTLAMAYADGVDAGNQAWAAA